MAQKVEIQLIDDIDGGRAEETVLFSLDNVAYEIDLNKRNAKRLRATLEEYTGKARKLNAKKTTRSSRMVNADSADIRAWAETQGIEVPVRGRIPKTIRQQYEQRPR